jgi:hypothetical protein
VPAVFLAGEFSAPVCDIDDMGGGVRYAYFSDPDGDSWALQQIDR